MRIPRSRGAVSGVLLVALGAWGAIVALIGPSIDLTIGSDSTWDLTTGRVLLEVLPGLAVVAGGLILLLSAHRAKAALGGWLALAGGVWFVVGPTLSRLWSSGDGPAGQIGSAAGSESRQVLELLTMLSGLGAAIIALAAFALGRLAVRSVRDVELARERELERSEAAPPALERGGYDEAPTRVAGRPDDDTAVAPPPENARR
ncbi:MAG TPA: hypothetical protein VN751_13210 [Solirubrobacteraceae bacterium]|jgi:hypothetical protein|nr:hypothetical protein [Solirubrobacteraceae bacterium]